MMDRIIRSAEADPMQVACSKRCGSTRPARTAIGAGDTHGFRSVPLSVAIAYTKAGSSALRLAHERPRCPIMGLTPNRRVARRLALAWGVHAVHAEDATNVEDMVEKALRPLSAKASSSPAAPWPLSRACPSVKAERRISWHRVAEECGDENALAPASPQAR